MEHADANAGGDDDPFMYSTFEFCYDAEQDLARYAEARRAALERMALGQAQPSDEGADRMWRCALDVVASPEYRAHARVVALRRDRAAWKERLVREATLRYAAAGLGRRVFLRGLGRSCLNVALNGLALARWDAVALRVVDTPEEEEGDAILGRFLAYMDEHTLQNALILVGHGVSCVVPVRHLFVYQLSA